MSELPASARWLRVGLAAGGLLFFAALACVGRIPVANAHPMPCAFRAVSGLPCLFCGGTRAARAIIAGDCARATYLNPLAFPALLAAGGAIVVLAIEAAAGIKLWNPERVFPKNRWFAWAVLLLALAWWVFHVGAALAKPKPELVDLKKPLAARLRNFFSDDNRTR